MGIIPITKELLVSPSSRSEFRAKNQKMKNKELRNKNMVVDVMLPIEHSVLFRDN